MPTEISQQTEPGVLIHLGAGSCPGLEHYLGHHARVVLVDADAAAVERLQRIALDEPRLRIIHAAVASEAGGGFLHEYNLPEATSVHPATGLLELYPGLRLVSKTPVELESVESVLASIDIDAHASNTIVVDLSGEEFPVLYTLAHRGLLGQFEEILVHGGRIPLYDGAMPLREIADWLRDEGFDLREEDDSADPDKPCVRFRRNRVMWLNRELQTRVGLLAADCAQLRHGLAQNEQIVAALRAQVEESNTAKAAAEKLAADRQALIEQANTAKAAAEKLAADRHAQIEQANTAKAAAEKLAADRHAQIEQANTAKAAAEKLAADRHAQIEQANTAKAVSEKLSANRLAEIEQLKSDLKTSHGVTVELERRQRQLVEEMVRAEGQISLIKDLLLRDGAI